MEQDNIIDDQQHLPEQVSYQDYTVGSGVRFINLIIDIGGYYCLAILIGVVLGVILNGMGEEAAASADAILYDELYSRIIGITIAWVYYFSFESLTGRTLGKMVTGTKVISLTGEPLTTGQMLRRTFSRLVPFEAFSFLGNGIGWHDRWSDTVVVRKSFPGDFDKE